MAASQPTQLYLTPYIPTNVGAGLLAKALCQALKFLGVEYISIAAVTAA